jgi:ATP-dependent exoDNAse (exonuclease V) beta subunit
MSDDQLLIADLQARKDALDVTRSFIVQAPAGSGKTELLIQRYLNLLSVVENPEEVVAITFTRKAAAEMQLRVLEALRLRISGIEPEAEHERRTYALAGQALEKSAALQWNLVGNPRRMRILTLDALNASIARSQPFSSSGSGARIIVGAELQAVHRAAALATLDWLAEQGDMRLATVEVLQHVDNNTSLYASYLSQMLGTRDQWLPFIGSGLLSQSDTNELRQKFEESLKFAVAEHLQQTAVAINRGDYGELFELCDYAASNMIEDGATSSSICALEGLTEAPEATPDELAKWQGVAGLLLTQKGQFRKTVNKGQGFPTTDKAKNRQQGPRFPNHGQSEERQDARAVAINGG